MAELASVVHPLPTSNGDGAPSPPADPFWQSTPRAAPSGLVSLMAAIQQAIPPAPVPAPAPAPLSKQAKPASATASRRPQCTHMYMRRLYGQHVCFVCGKVPSIGWLYACHQDGELARLDRFTLMDPDALPIVPSNSGYFDVQARLAESLGMRPDVIQGIRDLHYSFEQVDKLIRQKKRLLETIRKTENPSADGTPQTNYQPVRSDSLIASVGATPTPSAPAAPSADLPMTPAGTPTNTPAVSMANTPVKKHTKPKLQTCSIQVCHTCRPFFQDRLYMSFEAVLSGRMPALTEEEITRLPILDPSIVCSLGLRKRRMLHLTDTRSRESMDVTMQQTDGYVEDTSDWTPTSATISESDSEQLDVADQHPCLGAGVCPLWSRYSSCAYDADFDDGFRALSHGFGSEPDLSRITPENSYSRLGRAQGSSPETPGGTSSTASSISLPTPETVPLTRWLPTDESFDHAFDGRLCKTGKAASVCPILTSQKGRRGRLGFSISGKESSSSLGSEVEVEGGVALTEEAVETGTPDIVTDENV